MTSLSNLIFLYISRKIIIKKVEINKFLEIITGSYQLYPFR